MGITKFIFVLNGTNGSGKDTFYEMIKGMEEEFGITTSHISSIDSIKKMAKNYGWNGKKDEKGRELLFQLKSAWDNYNSFTQQDIFAKTKRWINNCGLKPAFFFVDIREPEKIQVYIDSIEKYFGDMAFIGTILIDSSRYGVASNVADQGVKNYEYSITINNDGSMDDLREKAHHFIDTMLSSR